MPKFPIEELPAEGGLEGGGRIPPHRPEIAELPRVEEFRFPGSPTRHEIPRVSEIPPLTGLAGNTHALAREVFHLRQRVYKLESELLFSGFGFTFGGQSGAPNELPAELELGGGSGRVPHIPGEINELPPFSIFQQVANLETRLGAIETNLLSSIQALAAKVEALSK
jgi:hypothetical protein